MNETERQLTLLSECVNKLRSTMSRIDKEGILSAPKYRELTPIFKMIYDPRWILNITGDTVDEAYVHRERPSSTFQLTELLEALHTRMITGQRAVQACLNFIEEYDVYYELIIDILNKDLECGISVKTLNRVFPKLITEFNVPLAKDYEPNRLDFKSSGPYWVSRKYNGIRCLTFIGKEKDDVKCFSREGIEFEVCEELIDELKEKYTGEREIILDGELCLIDENGNDDFQGILREIRKKNHKISNLRYIVFDLYGFKNFSMGISTGKYSETKYRLNGAMWQGFKHIVIAPQIKIDTINELNKLWEEKPELWEGLMLRSNNPTEFKRGYNLMKLKAFKTEDYIVESIVHGTKAIDGQQRTCVASLQISHKGFPVFIGSGLSDQQRLQWMDNSIIGKKITVQYFTETKNKHGELSLQFPTLLCVRDYEVL